MTAEAPWYQVNNVADIPSPALLIYPDRIQENIRRMIGLVSRVDQLRPHLKTHKMAEVLRMQLDQGIQRFKCATMAEAEMAAAAGVPDLLLAYQPVGPNLERALELVRRYPATRFSVLVDDAGIVRELSRAASRLRVKIDVFLDLDCGMHRCGHAPNDEGLELYRALSHSSGVQAAGIHAYDGHIHDQDPTVRAARCEASFAPILQFRSRLIEAGLSVPTVVAGGTPTFFLHARRPDFECSPGTTVFWDHGYGTKLPDLPFIPAAVVLTRVVSKPAPDLLCLDLGHKAVAAENPPPRVYFPDLPEAQAVTHSEEHLVVKTSRAAEFLIGHPLCGIPWHICPTVALHSEGVVIRSGRAEGSWKITRERRLKI